MVLLLLHAHQTGAQCSPGHAQSSWGHVGGALVVVVHVVDAVIVEVVCVVPPRTEIGNLCRLCATVGILTAYRGLWLPPPGS